MATINLQPSLVRRLETLAQGEGMTLEAYLQRLADLQSLEKASATPLSGDELEQLLDAESASTTPYQGTYSRADIYCDHD